MHADQAIALLVERALEGDHDELERLGALGLDVSRHFGDVGVIQRGVHFVQHEERGGVIPAMLPISSIQ